MAGWSDTKSVSSREKPPQLKDEVELMEFPKNEWKPIRLGGPLNSFAWTWNEFFNTKEKGKTNRFPKICLDYNNQTGEFDKYDKPKCPYRKAGLYISQRFLTNAIDRDMQENETKKKPPKTKDEAKQKRVMGEKIYVKDPGSKSYTVWKVCDFPSTAKDQIVSLTDVWHKKRLAKAKKKGINPKKIKRVELSDPKYGCDILVKFNPEAKGSGVWQFQLDDQTPLTDEELEMPMYDIEHLKSIAPETPEVAKKEWENLAPRLVTRDKEGNIIKKKKNDDDEDADDDDDDTDLEDDDEGKTNKKRNKKKSKSSKNEDPPWDTGKKSKKNKKNKSSKSSVKKKKKKSDDEDFDDLD